MVNPIRKETAYRLYLMARIRDMWGRGISSFTVQELAFHAGLKPTGNMYRQLRSFVEDGSLSLLPGWKIGSTRANVYFINPDPAMEGK